MIRTAISVKLLNICSESQLLPIDSIGAVIAQNPTVLGEFILILHELVVVILLQLVGLGVELLLHLQIEKLQKIITS